MEKNIANPCVLMIVYSLNAKKHHRLHTGDAY